MKKPEESSWTTMNHSVRWRPYKQKFTRGRMHSRKKLWNNGPSWRWSNRKTTNLRQPNLSVPVVSPDKSVSPSYSRKKIKMMGRTTLAMEAVEAIRDKNHWLVLSNYHVRKNWSSMAKIPSSPSSKSSVKSQTRLTSRQWLTHGSMLEKWTGGRR